MQVKNLGHEFYFAVLFLNDEIMVIISRPSDTRKMSPVLKLFSNELGFQRIFCSVPLSILFVALEWVKEKEDTVNKTIVKTIC